MLVAEAIVITVSEDIAEMTRVSDVAVMIMLSPTLKVFKNCVPVPVQVVLPVIVTVPPPVVDCATWRLAVGVNVPIPTEPELIILIASVHVGLLFTLKDKYPD